MRMNVRCCCQPQKILGTMDVPYEFSDRFFVMEKLEPMPVRSARGIVMSPISARHEIEIRDFVDYSTGERAVERAVYSGDRPVEFWRKIPGFVEAKE